MKNLTITLLCFIAAIQFSFAQSNVEDLINKLIEEYRQDPALVVKKYAIDDFVFINAEGGFWNKKTTLNAVSFNKLEDVVYTEKKFRPTGDIVIFTGINQSKWNRGGTIINYKDAFTYTFQIKGNDIKWLSAQHSLVTPKDRNKALYKEINMLVNERKLVEASKYYSDSHEIKGIGKGPKALEIFNQKTIDAFPDLQIKIIELIAEGDLVFARCEATGTHKGELNGILPTGKSAKIAHWTVNRFNAEGKIIESWNLNDNLSMMQQLGILK